MSYVLALDQGTTSSRALVIDERGRVVGQAQREFRQFFPSPGRVEHDPEEIWESQLGTARGAIAQAGISAADLSSIGITNQRETTVVWDRASGRAIGPAIVWQDRRTAGFCDRMKADGLEPLFRERTGLVLDPYFSGTKVRWMLDHVEGARSLAEAGRLAFGTVDSWLIWRLTGGRVHATDPSNASRTLLFNIHTLAWDDELLGALDIPRSILPEVRDSSGDFGQTAPGVFDAPVRLAGVAGDQQAALFGQLCLEPGMVKNTYGTGCFALMNAGGAPVASANNLLTTVAWTVGGKTTYALEGSVFVAGAVVQWLRDGLGLISSSADVETLAARVDDAGGVVFVPAFTGLGAPHWDAYARGGVMGLTRGTTSAHVARAALESIAFQSTDLIRAMEADSGVPVRELRVDGGATANDLLMQMQADFLGAPVIRPRMLETTALGAAYLAGLASGVWGSTTELAEQWQVDRRFTPGLPPEEVARRTRRWNRAVERVRRWDLDD